MLRDTAEKQAIEEIIDGDLTDKQSQLMRFIISEVRASKLVPIEIKAHWDETGCGCYECPTCLKYIETNRDHQCTCGQKLKKTKTKL